MTPIRRSIAIALLLVATSRLQFNHATATAINPPKQYSPLVSSTSLIVTKATPPIPVTPSADNNAIEPAPLPPTSVNGLPLEALVVMPAPVKSSIKAIFLKGQQLGNNPQAFTAIGDSIIAGGQFLTRFGNADYKLGKYAYLQPTLDAFAPSFTRPSTAVRIGLHSWSVMNPVWADKQKCEPNETVIACEFRLQKPSFVFIQLGSNDVAATLFDKSMRRIVQYSIENGVIPILITKADQRTGTEGSNDALRKIAAEYKTPILEFERLAATLPGRGLGSDGIHMTSFPNNDYTQPSVFKSGQAMHSLAALIALDAVWREAASPQN